MRTFQANQYVKKPSCHPPGALDLQVTTWANRVDGGGVEDLWLSFSKGTGVGGLGLAGDGG